MSLRIDGTKLNLFNFENDKNINPSADSQREKHEDIAATLTISKAAKRLLETESTELEDLAKWPVVKGIGQENLIFNDSFRMLISDPELYDKWNEYNQLGWSMKDENGNITLEGKKYWSKATAVEREWYIKFHFDEKGNFIKDPFKSRISTWIGLEDMYSNHDELTAVNFYSEHITHIPQANDIWQWKTENSLNLSTNHLTKLVEGTNEEKEKILKLIDDSMAKIKDVRKKCEYDGEETLHLGVKLYDNGTVTFHATNNPFDKERDLVANTAEELIELIREKY